MSRRSSSRRRGASRSRSRSRSRSERSRSRSERSRSGRSRSRSERSRSGRSRSERVTSRRGSSRGRPSPPSRPKDLPPQLSPPRRSSGRCSRGASTSPCRSQRLAWIPSPAPPTPAPPAAPAPTSGPGLLLAAGTIAVSLRVRESRNAWTAFCISASENLPSTTRSTPQQNHRLRPTQTHTLSHQRQSPRRQRYHQQGSDRLRSAKYVQSTGMERWSRLCVRTGQ